MDPHINESNSYIYKKIEERLTPQSIKNKSKEEIVSLMKSRIKEYQINDESAPPNSLISKTLKSVTKKGYDTVSGFINKNTILMGAKRTWDENRILTGKHVQFAEIGAEHLSFNCANGVVVDAHYFNSEIFVKTLELSGGSRTHFKVSMKDESPLNGKTFLLNITSKDSKNPRPDFDLEVTELNIRPLAKNASKEEVEQHAKLIADTRKYFKLEEKILKVDDQTGKYYVLDDSDASTLDDSTYCQVNGRYKGFQLKSVQIEKKQESEFDAIVFDKNHEHFNDMMKILNDLGLDMAAWRMVKKGDKAYLIKLLDRAKLELITDRKDSAEFEQFPCSPIKKAIRGTMLLTTNQSDIAEQHSNEVLSFLLEGLDVMIYNNPGKGLSKGSPSTENINKSIEACYEYLSQREIPDHLIFAKGQCAGAGPTAWLGRKHPHINLFLDQNPANFSDVASQGLNEFFKDVKTKYSQGGIKQLISHSIANYMIDNKALKAGIEHILGGYNIAQDISYNEGHKLIHINVPSANTIHKPKEKQFGGDRLIPDHHPELMLDSIETDKDLLHKKNIRLTFNIQGSHVTDWWMGSESYLGVTDFLKKNNLSQSLF